MSTIEVTPQTGIVHLSNFIGVEGRAYSAKFFYSIIRKCQQKNVHVVIDEGLWFEPPSYPKEITSPNVVRIVSPSKKYGIPGMKVGFLIADPEFIKSYYEEASSGYGGPASIFFLLLEMLMLFEYVWYTGNKKAFAQITGTYPDISHVKIQELYSDYHHCVTKNYQVFKTNRKILKAWTTDNKFVEEAHLLHGLNFFVRFKTQHDSMYSFFKDLLETRGVSIMPSSCFGDPSDSYARISILEETSHLQAGLTAITEFLTKPKAIKTVIRKKMIA